MERKNITIESLSELTGISVTRLREYELGKFNAKSYEILAISDALGIPPVILMHGGGTVHYSSIDDKNHRISKWEKY